jgi:cytochrome c553
MHPAFALGCLLAVAAFPATAAADPAAVAAGRKKAGTCAVCHGLNGLSKNPDAPNLAGDSANYLVKQLKAFQSGVRQDEQMSIMAKALSDEDVANLAAWYSSLEVTVEMPPKP